MRPRKLLFVSALAVLAVGMFLQSTRTKATDNNPLTFTDHVTYVSDGDKWTPQTPADAVSGATVMESFHAPKCSCDCPTLDEIRRVVREEIEASKASSYTKTTNSPAVTKRTVECSGGQCRVVKRPVTPAITYTQPATVTTYTTSGGSSGGAVSCANGQCSTRAVSGRPRLFGRLFRRR